MVIIPSLISEELHRDWVVDSFAKPNSGRRFGIVALSPSFRRSEAWGDKGSLVADHNTIEAAVNTLNHSEFEKTVVLVNRYDGIDLPDDTCRVLIFDSRPYSENLIDVYAEHVRPKSEATLMRTVRTVEQGLGRGVRGEKDYSLIVVTGPDLVRLVRERATRRFLSPQVDKQIQIGLDVAEMARQEVSDGEEPAKAFGALARQCFNRDPDWKARSGALAAPCSFYQPRPAPFATRFARCDRKTGRAPADSRPCRHLRPHDLHPAAVAAGWRP
jgi:hypothetical protein